MMRKRFDGVVSHLGLLAAFVFLPAVLFAGPYDETGIENTDLNAWATGYTNLVRGPVNIAKPELGDVTFGSPGNAVGAPECNHLDVISLGDGGQITMTFDPPITNGSEEDFVVFENGFPSGGYLYAELAFVEVSTDGQTFVRFPSVSLTPSPIIGDNVLDPTDVYNLAGKHPGGNIYPCQGTPFDLSELAVDPLVTGGQVDLDRIVFVRVVDVIGNGSTFDEDSPPNPVYDPYPTEWPQGGFDLQAIGVIHQLEAQGCFVATAAYGSPFAAKIDLLRAFRDTYLMKTSLGRKGVDFYYRNAEPWAAWIAKHESLRALTRTLLAPVIGLIWLLLGMP
jgi:hypothetical protein